MSRPRVPVCVAIGCLAAAVLLYEIALTRIFSFTIWHHFTSMVVSIALLGFGVSGVLLQVRPGLGQPALRRAAWYALVFGATAVVAVQLVTSVPFDPTALAYDARQVFYLFVYYAALLVPFAFAGLGIVTLLAGAGAEANRLYGFDLGGAGLACAVVVAAIRVLGAEGVVGLAAAGGACSAWLLRSADSPGRLRLAPAWLLAAVVAAAAVPWAAHGIRIRPGASKALRTWMDPRLFPGARLAVTRWEALGRIDVVENSGAVRWTANPHAPVALPRQIQIVIDGDASTPIVESNGDLRALEFLDWTLSSAAPQAFHPTRVLVVGAGGGVDVLTALRHGAQHVDAVEINPIIGEMVTRRYAAWSGGLFARRDVHLHRGEGRAFVRRSGARYDLVQLSLIDTWAAATSGAYSLAESYLYTTEAFRDYLEHLTPDGMLTLTRWLWEPPRETLKLCTVAATALRELGSDRPQDHIVVLALEGLGAILVQRSPFDAADLAALRGVAAARSFQILYAPDAALDSPYAQFLRSAAPDAFLDSYPYDVRPATDDSPFFFQFGRWRELNLLGAGWSEGPFLLSGRLVLLATLLQALVLSVLLLVVPVLGRGERRRAFRRRGTGAVVAYFFLIGLAFMLLEISLMQRFTLFLGHPVYAVAVVLAALLVSAGAGSLCASRLAPPRGRVWPVFAAIVGLGLLYAIGLPALFRVALGLGLGSRLGLGTLLLLPLGFLLGIPFPAALSRLPGAHQIGWAWAANGCASVLGPILAVLLAMDHGFRAVMLVAGLGYAAALAVFGNWDAAAEPAGSA